MKPEPNLSVATTSIVKVPKLKSGDDDEVVATFKDLFTGAQNGLRRVVAFGIYAWQVKLLKLKKGQFAAWVRGNCEGPGFSYRSVKAHLQLTESALKACGVKSIKNFLQKGSALPFSHCGEILLLPEANIPDSVKPLRDKLCSIIDGKSARQLFTEFKQADDDEENPKPKRGRLKGQGGASKEQRAAAQAAEEKARLLEIQLDAKDWLKWLDEVSDLAGLPKALTDAAFAKYAERVQSHSLWCREIIASRNAKSST